MTGERWLLAMDTGTSRVVVAAGRLDGTIIAEAAFPAEHRHGERLLATVDDVATKAGVALDGLAGIIVGTGPGAFTGLRVGLATAKTLAHELGVPIAGLSTGEALLVAAGGGGTVWLPAGPNDRVVVEAGVAPRLVTGAEARVPSGEAGARSGPVVAVDLDGRAPADAIAAGQRALDGLAAALLQLGRDRLAAGGDDLERLVPEYVTLPRGVEGQLDLEQGMAWSRSRP